MQTADDDAKWLRLSRLANRKRTAEIFERLLSAGIEPILIKGWAVERFYDSAHFRVSTDVDLVFDPELSKSLAGSLSAVTGNVVVDAHFGLLHLDKLPYEELYSRSHIVDLEGTLIRVLADEDNLRVTAVHWLTDGGVNKEKLWDIFYLIKNRKEGFDWRRCLDANGPVRKTWVMAAIVTARDHLDLDISTLPNEVREFELPGWYQRTLQKEWELGIYPRRVLAHVITRPKLLIEQIRRKFPPNAIAATIDTETPIDGATRTPAQLKSLGKKVPPFARKLLRRLTYSTRGRSK